MATKLVRMVGPKGEIADVPSDRVAFYVKQGAKRAPTAGSRALDVAPYALGGLGAVTGGPVGAALGGAAGAGIRQIGREAMGLDEPTSLGEFAGDMAKAGAGQAAFEVGGGLAAKGIKAAGRPIMQLALKSTPEVAQTAIQEGIAASRQGLGKLMNKIGEAGAATERLIGQASRSGAKFSQTDLAKKVADAVTPELQGLPGDPASRKAVEDLTRGFLHENPSLITPTSLQKLKQRADELALPIYKKIAAKEPITAREAIEYKWHKALADNARSLLETIPGVEQANARTQSLIQAKQALQPVAKRGGTVGERLAARSLGPAIGAGVGAALPGDRTRHGLEGAVAGAAATSPVALSHLALGMNSPLLQLLLTQGPRALTGALQ